MSDLLNQASLVMVPSGYKEDTVYSVVPSDGSGDLSFTRASNGTRVNSAGLVEVCPWNLIDNSQTFSSWGTVAIGNTVTVTDNFTTAPNGTLTAAKVVFATFHSTGQIYQNYTVSATQTLTATLYAKVPSGTKQCRFGFYDGNLKNQLKTLTTEWQRIEYTGSIDAGGVRACWLYGDSSESNVEVHLWGGQVNEGSTAKPYFPTTDRLNVPRLTYQNGGGGCPSLLLEKQSTNLCLYSEQFDDATWTKTDGTITANATTSPDGTQNADKCVANNGVVIMDMRTASAFSITSGNVYTWSLYVKKAGYRYCQMTAWTADDPVTVYDLDNGVVVSETGPSHTSTITSVGNGWYRITITRTATDSIAWMRFSPLASTSGTAQNGTDGTYIWGAQVEESSYSTSYIPTTSSSATRVADACYKTGISSLIGQSEGTLFFDGYCSSDAEIISINRSATNSVFLYSANGNVRAYVYSDSTGLNLLSSVSCLTRFKAAVAYKSNSIAFYVNGTLIAQNTSTTFTPNVTMESLYIAQGGYVQGKEQVNCNQAIIFPTRLTNAELQALTTI